MNWPLAAMALAEVRPPRPNLGPEPWPEPVFPIGPVLALTIVVLAIAASVGLSWWFKKRRRYLGEGESRPGEDPPSRGLIAWSGAVRAALSARFGPAWEAKTTDEIAGQADLPGLLGDERAGQLIDFLREADRAKFAGETDQGSEWEGWAASFVVEFGAEAGAISTIKGK